MKRKSIAIAILAMVLCLALSTAALAETKTISLKIGNPKMTVNGQQKEIDPGRGTKPLIVSGRTLVPIRTIVNEMGGTIAWNGKAREIVIYANNRVIRMYLNYTRAAIAPANSSSWTEKQLDVAPKSINGRTMVPLRFVSEQLGAKVAWNSKTKTVTITCNATPLILSQWSGAWSTNEGNMVFIQSGNKIQTSFDTDTIGKVTGTVSGKTFTGKWYVDGADNGTITLTLSNDGKSFTGKYTFKDGSNPPVEMNFNLNGTRS